MKIRPIYSTQGKLILSFVSVSLLVGLLSLIVGGSVINHAVLNEATDRISLDLNAAGEIYVGYEELIAALVRVVSSDSDIGGRIDTFDTAFLTYELSRLADAGHLDFAGFAFPGRGWDRYTLSSPPGSGGPEGIDARTQGSPARVRASDTTPEPFIAFCFEARSPVSGTTVLSEAFLQTESPLLSEEARIEIIPTDRAEERTDRFETEGMAIVAAAPIFDSGSIVAVIYGGILLNRNTEIVDRIRDTVFVEDGSERASAGTATIFLRDLRVSTNVRDTGGDRAIGTEVSKEVKGYVLERGLRWSDRAFVVHDWYRTAYDPIHDMATGERIGMLYVGILDRKYVELRQRTLLLFIGITVGGIVAAIALGYILGRILLRPIRLLISASSSVRDGNLDPDIGPLVRDELGVLQRTFRTMLRSLKERAERQAAESETILMQFEKQASIGRLAAGVAHEINNPLTSVLTFSHLLLERTDLPPEVRDDLRVIADSTERVRSIVRGLLDLSRQTELHLTPTDMHDLVESSVKLIRNQADAKGITITTVIPEQLPLKTLDFNQMQSVLINLLINAIDASGKGDSIQIIVNRSLSSTRTAHHSNEAAGIEIAVQDTGKGIEPEHMQHLFDPFFTTKPAGEGTGLGLAVSLQIVERHDGNIRVQSEPGVGSTFHIWLPPD